MLPVVDVVIVGGGISGLSAARELCRQGLRVRLLERAERCGGVIKTLRVGDCVVDFGPDTLLAHKPAALALCRELGLEDQLVAPMSPRTLYLLRSGTFHALPEASMMGLPANWTSLATSRAFTWRGKFRMGCEIFLPAGPRRSDESIASFIGRRFGSEAVTCLAEPLLAGLHRGNAQRLSMRALFPSLLDGEQRHGSVIRALSKNRSGNGRAGSMSLRGGLSHLPERLEQSLPRDVVMTGVNVKSVGKTGTGQYTVTFDETSADERRITARAVLFATPAHVTARLVDGVDLELAKMCGAIEYASSVTVALAYAKNAVRDPLKGWGFVVPAAERRLVTTVSWVSSKWPDRAPENQVLIRASIGRHGQSAPLENSDVALTAWADDDLRELLGITAPPIATQVCRWPQAMPQLHVGHLDRMGALDRRLASLPGLFISAAGFRGAGIPDCIADAQTTAKDAAAYIRALSATDTSPTSEVFA
jgi:protoporphyrinogen/coproporphyrinogen III oxidase